MRLPVVALREIMHEELDAISYADAVWLAAVRTAAETNSEVVQPTVPIEPETPDPAGNGDTGDASTHPGLSRSTRPLALSGLITQTEAALKARPLGIRPARSMPEALSLGRSLRPFKRKWPYGTRKQLDIGATANMFAYTHRIMPIFKPAPERWFDVELLVDTSPTMQMWRSLAADFGNLLERTTAFRSIRVSHLSFVDSDPILTDPRSEAARQLDNKSLRRMICVFTDGYAEGWSRQGIWKSLRAWASAGPTALISPLPTRLWGRTGLNHPGTSAMAAGASPTTLRLRADVPSILMDAAPDWIPVAAATLTPESLRRWANAVMRGSPEGCAALLVPPDGRLDQEEDDKDLALRIKRDPKAILFDFRRYASPLAQRLAVLCAPYRRISMPLLDLLRQELLPEATVGDAAQLIVCGLFDLTFGKTGQLFMAFRPGVSSMLTDQLAYEDLWLSHAKISDRLRLEQQRPTSIPAATADPEGSVEIPGEESRIGDAEQDLLRCLGVLPPLAPVSVEKVTGRLEEPDRSMPKFAVQWATWPLASAGAILHDIGRVLAVCALVRDGRSVVLTGGDRLLRVWDLETGESLHEMRGHSGAIMSVASIEVEGRCLAISGAADSTVRVWDIETGEQRSLLTNPKTERVNCVAAQRLAQNTVVIAGGNRFVRLWDANNGDHLGDLAGHRASINVLATGMADGRLVLASGGNDETIRLWDPESLAPIGSPLHTSVPVRALALGELAGHPVIVSAGTDPKVNEQVLRVWDASTLRPLHWTLSGRMPTVTSIAIGSMLGRQSIIVGSSDGALRFWCPSATSIEAAAEVGSVVLEPIQALMFSGTVNGVAMGEAGRVVVATDKGLAGLVSQAGGVP